MPEPLPPEPSIRRSDISSPAVFSIVTPGPPCGRIVATPFPYEPTVIGSAAVPASPRLNSSAPANSPPPSRRILAPGAKLNWLACRRVRHASSGEVPDAPLSPPGLT
jgi:hypothetical protein